MLQKANPSISIVKEKIAPGRTDFSLHRDNEQVVKSSSLTALYAGIEQLTKEPGSVTSTIVVVSCGPFKNTKRL